LFVEEIDEENDLFIFERERDIKAFCISKLLLLTFIDVLYL